MSLAPPRDDHSPSGIPELKSYPRQCSKSCDHHSSQSTQVAPGLAALTTLCCQDHLPGQPSGSRGGMWDHDTMGSRLSSTVLDQLKYDTGLAGIPEVLPSPSTGNQSYPADIAGEPLGHSSCLTSSAAALKSKTKQKTPTYQACHEVTDWKKQSQRHRKCAGTVLKYNFSTT